MRHARRHGQLSRPAEPRQAMLSNMAVALLRHGRIRTTLSKAKAMQRLGDRLISLGKDGSVHARRQAFKIVRDRDVVKQLFAEVAPRFLDCQGGYTRVLKLIPRIGDGASMALLEFTRLPVEAPKAPPKGKAKPPAAPKAPESGRAPSPKGEEEAPKPKKFLEGLRDLFKPKKRSPAQT